MESIRKPYQGVFNIIRFNWHFYVIVFFILAISGFISVEVDGALRAGLYVIIGLAPILLISSLLISWHIYDRSCLYSLDWLKGNGNAQLLININAGFDETSQLLKHKFSGSDLLVLDFYDPRKHTEISIERARKAYPPFVPTIGVNTNKLPLENESADKIFLLLSAHEIRNDQERNVFFNEINRILKPDGKVYVLEHLRDSVNFLAYTIGVFHFHSRKTWLRTFSGARLTVQEEKKQTPFLSLFILCKNGNTP